MVCAKQSTSPVGDIWNGDKNPPAGGIRFLKISPWEWNIYGEKLLTVNLET